MSGYAEALPVTHFARTDVSQWGSRKVSSVLSQIWCGQVVVSGCIEALPVTHGARTAVSQWPVGESYVYVVSKMVWPYNVSLRANAQASQIWYGTFQTIKNAIVYPTRTVNAVYK